MRLAGGGQASFQRVFLEKNNKYDFFQISLVLCRIIVFQHWRECLKMTAMSHWHKQGDSDCAHTKFGLRSEFFLVKLSKKHPIIDLVFIKWRYFVKFWSLALKESSKNKPWFALASVDFTPLYYIIVDNRCWPKRFDSSFAKRSRKSNNSQNIRHWIRSF